MSEWNIFSGVDAFDSACEPDGGNGSAIYDPVEFEIEGDGATTSGIEYDTTIGDRELHVISTETYSPDGSTVIMMTVWENGSIATTSIEVASESGVDTYGSVGGEPVVLIGHVDYPQG